MDQKYFYLILMATFLTVPFAFAGENLSVNACEKNKDCRLIVYACNQAVTFNKIHAAKQKEKLCKSEDCSLRDCAAFRHFNHSVECLENQCIVKSIAKDNLDPGGKKWVARFVHAKRRNFAKNEEKKTPVGIGTIGKPAQ